jgi:hypothetical protein
MSSTIKRKIGSVTICVVIGASLGLWGAQAIKNRQEPIPYSYSETELTRDGVNTISEESILKELKQILSVEIANAEVETNVSIINSWGTWDMFKNTKTIYFKGKGIYKINFDNVDDSNIRVNNSTKTIIMYLPIPKISVELNHDEYEYTTDKGILRFDEVIIEPEQAYEIENKAIEQMKELMSEEESMNSVKEEAANQLTTLIRRLANEKYDIQIKWVE